MSLIQQFQSIDIPTIERYVEEMEQETLFLDFKTVRGGSLKSDDDKKNLSKALSGFANSAGGLIVWGVLAKKNENNIDCATKCEPIQNISQFYSRLNELTGEYVQPLVEKVEHKILISDQIHDIGFAVSLIPESLSPPHMAVIDGRYYKRSGASFYPLEHFDLEDMFGRRRKANLSLSHKLINSPGDANKINVQIIIQIVNTGKGVAEHVFLNLKPLAPYSIFAHGFGNFNHGLKRLLRPQSNDGEIHFAATDGIVIHPNYKFDVTPINLTISKIEDNIHPIKIYYNLYTAGTIEKTGIYEISEEILRDEIKKLFS
ncbi:ATP-binding protein [Leptospira meyeri]|uniref:AlbA family DNA-binding domain-containing protein n=1 Tax=Leptospira meyeri TaxID=29508 RepID=UPI0010839244|nr:ATP-binding protein [Leptospira meyeri]TGM60592.1 ATP-binding protein [Leptospira meyeri]TGM68630.1 ATP-binding protein [Leptospira meyeri]